MTGPVADLFAGPGGWSLALRRLGIGPEFGYDYARDVILTRRAAGLHAEHADVGHLAAWAGPYGGLIASPPCPLFSNAGGRVGLHALDLLADAVGPVLDGEPVLPAVREAIAQLIEPVIAAQHPEWDAGTLALDIDTRALAEARQVAYEASMVLEPARWLAAGDPGWLAAEQVPAVLPVWQRYVTELAARGWHAWAGTVNAADYGVPQTRVRAVLLASRTRPVGRPPATHAKDGAGGLPPWVTMAKALPDLAEALAGDGRVGFPRRVDPDDHRGDPLDGYRTRDTRPLDEPSFAVTEKARSWVVHTGQQTERADGVIPYERDIDEPAPTVTQTARSWTLNTGRDWKPGGTREDCQRIPADQPAPALTAKSGGQWWLERPATTIAGDPRVFPPGGHIANDGRDNSRMVGRSENTIRLEVWQALVLQSFPPDWPVKGTLTSQFRQVGDAVPPGLAVHLLAEAAGVPLPA